MKKKIIAALLATSMVATLTACGEEAADNNSNAGAASATETYDASIDFEDGNYGFAMVSTGPRKADASELSVADFNGSKALKLTQADQEKAENYIGFDVDALLGDKVTEVAQIKLQLGVAYADGTFNAVSGKGLAYCGEEQTECDLGAWSVYLETKNPSVLTFDMGANKFTAGNDNYFVICKDTDNGATKADLFVDNIAFLDASGNVIAADTSVVMEVPNEKYLAAEEEEEVAGVDVYAVEDGYPGDWSAFTPIDLSAYSGEITVTFKYELEAGYDYYLMAPMNYNGGWVRVAEEGKGVNGYVGFDFSAPSDEEKEGLLYHLQNDGFIVIDNWDNKEITVTLSADAVASINEQNEDGVAGMLSAQVYGVNVYEVDVVAGGAAAGAATDKLAVDDGYPGDWGAFAPVDLSAYSGDLDVTFKYELEPGYDYYLMAPMNYNGGWTRIAEEGKGTNGYVGFDFMAPTDEEKESLLYHLQNDGFIVIDNWDNTEINVTLSADTVAALNEQNEDGVAGMLSCQVYGVTVYEIDVTPAGAAAAPAAGGEKVALDDSYPGDWSSVAPIGPDVLEKYRDTGVTVTYKMELEPGYDWYGFLPMDLSDWKHIGESALGMVTMEESDKWHMNENGDGGIIVDDTSIEEITFFVTAEGVQRILDNVNEEGYGGLSAQPYGTNFYEAVLK